MPSRFSLAESVRRKEKAKDFQAKIRADQRAFRLSTRPNVSTRVHIQNPHRFHRADRDENHRNEENVDDIVHWKDLFHRNFQRFSTKILFTY